MRDVAGAVGGEQRAPNVCGVIITLKREAEPVSAG